ncbi:MAG: hypothetical protein KIT31_18615 [Deltaproteobacteria bacterium]|nr:hypothetical protein [Deltaproteobacteria bacterium]
MADATPPKRRGGNPAMVVGGPSLNPKGRPSEATHSPSAFARAWTPTS